MMDSLFENEQYATETGPLLWYQRPLMLAMYIGVGFLFVGLVAHTLLQGQFLEKRFRHSKNTPDEISYGTIEQSSTSNDRLVTINQLVVELDDMGRKYYGELHEWHDPQAEPPFFEVSKFVHWLNDPTFDYLHRYNQIAEARLEYSQIFQQLENDVDTSVSELGSDPTADYRFRSERLLRIEVANAIKQLQRHVKNLEKLGLQFQQDKKGLSQ